MARQSVTTEWLVILNIAACSVTISLAHAQEEDDKPISRPSYYDSQLLEEDDLADVQKEDDKPFSRPRYFDSQLLEEGDLADAQEDDDK